MTETSSSRIADGATVRLHGLVGKPELNGRSGTVIKFDQSRHRYAVAVVDAPDAILVKPANVQLVLDGAYSSSKASELASMEGATGREARLAALMQHSASLHQLKEEGATHAEAVARATSRATLADDVWDRVVEIQRLVTVATRACDDGFPALASEALAADDPLMWSRASVEYAHYLLGQPPKQESEDAAAARGSQKQQQQQQQPPPPPPIPPSSLGKRLAKRVLKVHACEMRCRDALLAAEVLAAEGPFDRVAAEEVFRRAGASDATCPCVDAEAWRATREREAMREDLQAHWDAAEAAT